MNVRALLLAVPLAFALPSAAAADPPEKIRIQGTISQLGGAAVIDDVYQFEVRLYEQASGGVALVTMPATGNVAGGAYSLLVGPTTPGDLSAVIDQAGYVEIEVVSNSGGAIGETLVPRQQLASVPFALNASGGSGCTSRGRLRSASASTMVLEPEIGEEICLRVDGSVARSATSITFDMAAHLEIPLVEAADRFYYLYLSDESGVLTPHVSETPPSVDTSTAGHGHHPTQTTWRFVQAVRNDTDLDLVPFSEDEPGRLTLLYRVGAIANAWPERCGGTGCSTGPPGYSMPAPSETHFSVDFASFVPVGATEARLHLDLQAEESSPNSRPIVSIAGGDEAASLVGTPFDDEASPYVLSAADRERSYAFWWVHLSRSAPSLAVVNTQAADITRYRIMVFGWAY